MLRLHSRRYTLDVFKKMIGQRVGPGGIKCPCCAYGKTKDRKQFYTQIIRKRLKDILDTEIQEALWEIEDDKIDIAS